MLRCRVCDWPSNKSFKVRVRKITALELLLVQKVTLSQETHIDLKASILGRPYSCLYCADYTLE